MALGEKLGGIAFEELLEARFANSAAEVAEAKGEYERRAAASTTDLCIAILKFKEMGRNASV